MMPIFEKYFSELKKTFFILLFSLFFVALSAQEGLVIRNLKNGKGWMYEKNSRITYILFHENEYTTAILTSLLDSSVVLGKDTVMLKDIAGIRKKSPTHNITRIIGMPLMLIGSLFMGDGVAGMITNPDSDGGTKLFLLGAGVFTLGYLPYMREMEDLTVGFKGEWSMEICKGCVLK